MPDHGRGTGPGSLPGPDQKLHVDTNRQGQDSPSLLDLLDDPPSWITVTAAESIEQRFWRFHLAHPEVYDELVAMARQVRWAGQQRVGMRQLFEVLRWNRALLGLVDEGESFRLNNVYGSRYSRLIMELEQDLDGVFEVRELRS